MTEEQPILCDFFIRLPSADAQQDALSAFCRQDYQTEIDPETGDALRVPVGDPYLVQSTKDYAIDVVSTIYRPTGVVSVDSDGVEVAEMAPIDGWHINIRLIGDAYRAHAEALFAEFGVTPQQPSRLFL